MGFEIDDRTQMSVTITVTQEITWGGSLADLPANIADHVRESVESDDYSLTIDDALSGAIDTADARVWLQANGSVDSEEITVEEVTYGV